ncbi:hypothetical protein niasHS_010790 [Heterodera schachtii]|uniref:Proteasomal ubiquitin receptor ADRM1 n=1 Tax=Heterodera schachtii TaxID=97005 RepID=A0ABD2J389_HETSC
MSVMFANSRGQPTTGIAAGHLFEFKAGRTLIELGSSADKRRAVANPDPGLIYIKHSQDDQLLHLCWLNRKRNETELDLIIFPGETEFKRINECKSARVFMLKFKNSEERHLFWLQEQDDGKKDDEICRKMNEFLSNAPPIRPSPATAASIASAAVGAGRTPTDRTAGTMEQRYAAMSNAIGGNLDDIGALGNMDQNQLMRLFSLMNGGANVSSAELANLGQIASTAKAGGGSGAGGIPSTIGPISSVIGQDGQQQNKGKSGNQQNAKGVGPITPQLLDQIIKAATVNSGTTDKTKTPSIDLSTFLTRANTQEIVTKNKEELKQLLPDQMPMQNADSELAQTVGNPQFQQSADFFGHALQLGQLSDALEQFGFKGEVVEAAKKGDLQQFAAKLTEQESPKKAEVERAIKKETDAEETDTAQSVAAQSKKKKDTGNEAKSSGPEDDDGMDLD